MSLKKCISIGITCTLIFFLLLTTFLSISSKTSGSSLFGHRILVVLSGSMEPTIQTGSIILMKVLEGDKNLKKGDVITFQSNIKPGILVTHRIEDVIVRGETIEYITKGDNNNASDPEPIPSKNVVGVYSNITIPFAGYALSFLQSKGAILMFIIIPALAVIIYQIVFLTRSFTRTKHEKVSTKN